MNRAQRSAINLETRWSVDIGEKGWNAWNVCERRFLAAVPRRHAGRNANKSSVLLLLHARLRGALPEKRRQNRASKPRQSKLLPQQMHQGGQGAGGQVEKWPPLQEMHS